ncbi:hypothetical protein B484DRAFT_450836, partial [Ochromonadaceae sp. CCMP2298]
TGPNACYSPLIAVQGWPQCQSTCADLGASMLCIRSPEEYDFVSTTCLSTDFASCWRWVDMTYDATTLEAEWACPSTFPTVWYSNFPKTLSDHNYMALGFRGAYGGTMINTPTPWMWATCMCQRDPAARRHLRLQ